MSFSSEVNDEKMNVKVQGFLRQQSNREKFDQFFRGDGQQKLFIFYQTPEVPGAEVDDWSPDKGTPEIFISSGSTTRLASKCCAFVRAAASGVALDTQVGSDASLLFTELSDTVLGSVQSYLHGCFRPVFEASEQWGRADEEQQRDFMGEMEHFAHNVAEALHSLVGGLELRKPDIKAHEALNARNFSTQAKQNPELVPHFEELLGGWCNQIQEYLDEPGKSAETNEDGEPTDVGPRAELEYWRNRMQRLTSIAEQLKRKDCKNVRARARGGWRWRRRVSSRVAAGARRWRALARRGGRSCGVRSCGGGWGTRDPVDSFAGARHIVASRASASLALREA